MAISSRRGTEARLGRFVGIPFGRAVGALCRACVCAGAGDLRRAVRPVSRRSRGPEYLTAVPKRRTSKRKKLARRTHYKAATIALQPCPRCGDLKRPHRVCPTCGYYRDEQRVPVEDA